jgi:hypothetical protein
LLALVEACIIQHDHISWSDFRTQTFCYPSIECLCISASIKSHGSKYTISSHSSYKSRSFVSISILFWWCRFPYRRPASTLDLIMIDSTLINIYDASYFCDFLDFTEGSYDDFESISVLFISLSVCHLFFL